MSSYRTAVEARTSWRWTAALQRGEPAKPHIYRQNGKWRVRMWESATPTWWRQAAEEFAGSAL